MKQILCDRCNTVMCKPMYFKLDQTNWYSDVPNKKFHLCDDCYMKFIQFIQDKGVSDNGK